MSHAAKYPDNSACIFPAKKCLKDRQFITTGYMKPLMIPSCTPLAPRHQSQFFHLAILSYHFTGEGWTSRTCGESKKTKKFVCPFSSWGRDRNPKIIEIKVAPSHSAESELEISSLCHPGLYLAFHQVRSESCQSWLRALFTPWLRQIGWKHSRLG